MQGPSNSTNRVRQPFIRLTDRPRQTYTGVKVYRGAAIVTDQIELRLADLETKFSFQEQLLSDLNEVVTRQSHLISELERKLELLSRRESGTGAGDPSKEPPPPHY